MSHARQNLSARLRVVPALLGAAVILVGCSAGQITQTDTQVASVNGASGQAGAIAVRDAQLAFPAGANHYYSRGDAVQVLVTIANSGGKDDRLISVTSPMTGPVQIQGTTTIAAGTAVSTGPATTASSTSQTTSTASTASSSSATSASSTPASSPGSSASSTSKPTSTTAGMTTTSLVQLPLGVIKILLTSLAVDRLTPGQTIPVTFTFASAGQVTLQLPIAAPTSAGQ